MMTNNIQADRRTYHSLDTKNFSHYSTIGNAKKKSHFIATGAFYIARVLKKTVLLMTIHISRKTYSALKIMQELLHALCKLVCFVVTVFIIYPFISATSANYDVMANAALLYPAALIACLLYAVFLDVVALGVMRFENAITRSLSNE